jgi:DNA-3-methyladenine glycosylase II
MVQLIDNIVQLNVVRPFDFTLFLRNLKSFEYNLSGELGTLRLATRIEGTPTLIEIRQVGKLKGKIIATSTPEVREHYVQSIAEWVLFAELDLTPFYSLAAKDPRLAIITRKLHGLKPMRSLSLFETAIIAITEQFLSTAVARDFRSRLIQKFGESLNDEWIFPEPSTLAKASLQNLRSCGLSRQKAELVHDLATLVAEGKLDLDILKTMDDEKVRKTIMNLHGFGKWSADVILMRGLARPDSVPIDDPGVQKVVGEYLGNSQSLSSPEVAAKLEPFRPYRGLLVHYLFVAQRLKIKIVSEKREIQFREW